jgi:hypothetical protein
MKLAQVIALAAAGGFLATDKKPEDLTAYLIAEDKKAKDNKGAYDRAHDEAEEAEDAMSEAYDRKSAAMDEEEEESDKTKGEDKAAKDRKTARDARKSARDLRKTARDARKTARDKRAKDTNLDPEGTNDNSLGEGQEGKPAKTGATGSTAPGMDSATVSKMISDAVLARDSLHAAAREVEPIVGVRAFDSAELAYKAGLEALGVDIAGVPPAAYRAMLNLAKGSRAAAPPDFALDQGSQAEVLKFIPHLNRL